MGQGEAMGWALGLVILAALVAVIARRRAGERCLDLLAGFRVTVLAEARPTAWGDLSVRGHGVALAFDAPLEHPATGLVKASALVYGDELGRSLCLVRTVHGLAPAELARRERQIAETFERGILRRARRALDGHRPEPLLEPLVGKAVVLELGNPTTARQPVTELPGTLVEYSDRYLAVFNADHTPEEAFSVELGTTGRPVLDRHGLVVEIRGGSLIVTWAGQDVVVMRQLRAGASAVDLGVALLPGCSVALPIGQGPPLSVLCERTRRLDIVCPRPRGRIRFASVARLEPRTGWRGLPPADPPEEPPLASLESRRGPAHRGRRLRLGR
jgi:hypothetical protein